MTTQILQQDYDRSYGESTEYLFREYPHSVISGLSDGKAHRFNDLKRVIRRISSNTLSATLSRLVSDGLVNRLVIPTVPPSVEYSLTQKGMELLDVYEHASEWTSRWSDIRI